MRLQCRRGASVPLMASRCQRGGFPTDRGSYPRSVTIPRSAASLCFVKHARISGSSLAIARAITAGSTPAPGTKAPPRSKRSSVAAVSPRISRRRGRKAPAMRSRRACSAWTPLTRSSSKERPRMRVTIEVKVPLVLRSVKLPSVPAFGRLCSTATACAASRRSSARDQTRALEPRSRPRIQPATTWKPRTAHARSEDARLYHLAASAICRNVPETRMPCSNLSTPCRAGRLLARAFAGLTAACVVHGVGLAATLPTAPQTFDTSYIAPTGATVNVAAGGDLQAALHQAQLGDTIVLQAGATFTGPFLLPNKTTGSGWIYVVSSNLASLPPPGQRVGPKDAVNMPKIVSPASSSAVKSVV